MTTDEYIQLKKEQLLSYDKQAKRYNKLAISYLEKFKHQRDLCNDILRDIENLKNKSEQEKATA